jgi:mono/diheme cytochrome c family protein
LLRGVRGDGAALHPLMPYWAYGNMTEADALAIVAYLRSVPALAHAVAASQAPFDAVEQPAPRLDIDSIPKPAMSNANYESAKHGRYLAASIGACIGCHTPGDEVTGIQVTRAFQSPSNLTPDATGLASWSEQEIVEAIKLGEDRMGTPLCAPMPAAFSGMTESDALDIARYLQTLAAAVDTVDAVCDVPVNAGLDDAGVDDAG